MFGVYISTSVRAGGNAFPILPIASASSGSTFNMGMFNVNGGLAITGGARRAASAPAATTASTTVAPSALGATTAF